MAERQRPIEVTVGGGGAGGSGGFPSAASNYHTPANGHHHHHYGHDDDDAASRVSRFKSPSPDPRLQQATGRGGGCVCFSLRRSFSLRRKTSSSQSAAPPAAAASVPAAAAAVASVTTPSSSSSGNPSHQRQQQQQFYSLPGMGRFQTAIAPPGSGTGLLGSHRPSDATLGFFDAVEAMDEAPDILQTAEGEVSSLRRHHDHEGSEVAGGLHVENLASVGSTGSALQLSKEEEGEVTIVHVELLGKPYNISVRTTAAASISVAFLLTETLRRYARIKVFHDPEDPSPLEPYAGGSDSSLLKKKKKKRRVAARAAHAAAALLSSPFKALKGKVWASTPTAGEEKPRPVSFPPSSSASSGSSPYNKGNRLSLNASALVQQSPERQPRTPLNHEPPEGGEWGAEDEEGEWDDDDEEEDEEAEDEDDEGDLHRVIPACRGLRNRRTGETFGIGAFLPFHPALLGDTFVVMVADEEGNERPISASPSTNAPHPDTNAAEAASTNPPPPAAAPGGTEWAAIGPLKGKYPLTSIPRYPGEGGDGNNAYSQPDATEFMVRGLKYMVDKVKIPSQHGAYHLLGVDLLLSDQKHSCVSKNERSFVQRCRRQGGVAASTFLIIMNFSLPWGSFLAYFCPAHEGPSPYVGDAKLDALLRRFLEGDDDFRNQRLKVIPRCVEGPWMVKAAVGSTPAIMGTKIAHTYHDLKEENAFEIEIDISSSVPAQYILGMVKSFTQIVSVDLAFVLQGEGEEELPERVLFAVRFHHLNVPKAPGFEEWESRP